MDTLKEHRVHVSAAAHSSVFVKSSKAKGESLGTPQQYTGYAVGMVSEYISPANEERLRDHLG